MMDDPVASSRLCCDSEYDGSHESGCAHASRSGQCVSCGRYYELANAIDGLCPRCGQPTEPEGDCPVCHRNAARANPARTVLFPCEDCTNDLFLEAESYGF